MKKTISLILVLTLCLGLLAGCAANDPGASTTPNPVTQTDATGASEETEAPTEPSEETEAPTEPSEETEAPTEAPAEEEVKDITPESMKDKLLVENVSPYTGVFLEGEKSRSEDAYALKITNISDKTIFAAELRYNDGNQDLVFFFEILPPRATAIVTEQTALKMESENLEYQDGYIKYLKSDLENGRGIEITPTDQSTLIIKNPGKEDIPCLWVFYRKMEADGTLLGGRCFWAYAEELEAGEVREIDAGQWMRTCVVVDVVTMEKLVEDESELWE